MHCETNYNIITTELYFICEFNWLRQPAPVEVQCQHYGFDSSYSC